MLRAIAAKYTHLTTRLYKLMSQQDYILQEIINKSMPKPKTSTNPIPYKLTGYCL